MKEKNWRNSNSFIQGHQLKWATTVRTQAFMPGQELVLVDDGRENAMGCW
ncbi:hypothetical protein [Desulfobacter hydrogenophilus]|nr:hypothetical protein [Desulfobacter hydrogenophilus]NDY70622.1 hypothetical protein [Desulfobacter hydrogenophilus]